MGEIITYGKGYKLTPGNKHGYMPAWQNCVPDTSLNDVINFLKIKK